MLALIKMRRMFRWFSVLLFFMAVPICHANDADTTQSDKSQRSLSFNADVRPVLSNHCFFCHGPDEENRQADLRLDIEGEADLDEVLVRIESTDEDEIMPPPESHKELTPQQIGVLKRWIEEGGQYEEHWSFVPLSKVDVPSVQPSRWNANAIDKIVFANLQKQSLTPSPPADRRTLLRRLSLDLTGLPPTREAISEFLADQTEAAYEKQVDRLLASDRYGEHLGRYWLDLVRFADTNGLHHDHYREMTPYRDWVIDAFNKNLPFDQFTHWQIAGDLFDDPTKEQLIASGFNRLHLIIDVGTALPEESFYRNVVDRVSSVGTAFMGLTLQCAACHDHKYDPITQRDFYQMYAFFNNIDAKPETGHRKSNDFHRGLQRPYIDLSNPQQQQQLKRINRSIKQLETKLKQLKKTGAESPENSSADDSPGANDEGLPSDQVAQQITKQEEKLAALKRRQLKLLKSMPAALVMKERKEIRPAHILIRGVYDQPGEEVSRDTPGFLPPLESDNEVKTRLDLARWLTDPQNPLTARVAVNRFWQQLFGVGLVKTSEDFGAQGEVPRYQGLLDHLAVEFIESGWDVKRLIREIVMSQTYQQSSVADAQAFRNDPENRWLARGSRFRIDAEMVRDQILAATGLLNIQMKGKSVRPPQPEGLWKLVTMPSSNPRIFSADRGPDIYRRSVYTFWKRGLPPPQMTIFDAPSRESCIARRERTNTPLQALVLMNETEYFRITVNYVAKLLVGDDGSTDGQEIQTDARLEQVYETITSKALDLAIRQELKRGLKLFRQQYRRQPELAAQMKQTYLARGDSEASTVAVDVDAVDAVELASWTMLVHSLLNLDETRTRE